MKGIWLGETGRLTGYSATTRVTATGSQSTIKLQITTSDAYELANILDQLERVVAAQKPKAKSKSKPLLLGYDGGQDATGDAASPTRWGRGE
jgi:hypothetical protein